MIDNLLLKITPSDDYTNYLFMTTGLTNARIHPILNQGQDFQALSDAGTLLIRCVNSRRQPKPGEPPVSWDSQTNTLCVLSRTYLDDDGTLHNERAERAREQMSFFLNRILLSPGNVRAFFRQYVPLFWMKRALIYEEPRYYFATCRHSDDWPGEAIPLGAVLTAMEEDPRNFRLRIGGGCNCKEKAFILDAEQVYGEHWFIYTWCPVCHARRTIRAWHFERAWNCERSIAEIAKRCDRGQGDSPLTLFDVADALQSPSYGA